MTKRANALCWTKDLTISGQSTQQLPGEHVSDGTKKVHTHTPASWSISTFRLICDISKRITCN